MANQEGTKTQSFLHAFNYNNILCALVVKDLFTTFLPIVFIQFNGNHNSHGNAHNAN
jgi:hypothetical protein